MSPTCTFWNWKPLYSYFPIFWNLNFHFDKINCCQQCITDNRHRQRLCFGRVLSSVPTAVILDVMANLRDECEPWISVRQISRRLTSVHWQFINITRTLLQTTDGKFKNQSRTCLNFFSCGHFSSWTTRLGDICDRTTRWRTTNLNDTL